MFNYKEKEENTLKVKNRVKEKKREAKTKGVLYLDKFLIISFLCIFVALILVQAALLSPLLRNATILKNSQEGTPLGTEVYLYNEGSIELALEGNALAPALKVLVNGEERACFDKQSVELNVIDGDIIEVDGSEVGEEVSIRINSVSNNLDKNYIGQMIRINGKVQKLIKVVI